MGNAFFEENIQKFTWVSGADGHYGLSDLIIVQEENRNTFLDINIYLEVQEGESRTII